MSTAHRTLSVLMVTGAYHPEISSGGLQCQTMARELAGKASVSVLTTAVDPQLPAHGVVEGVPVTRIHVDVTSTVSTAAASGRMLAALARLLPKTDVVHIHGCSSKNVPVVMAAKAASRPVVLSLHTAGHDEPETVKRTGALRWWAFKSADRFLSVSPSLVEACLAAGFSRDRVGEVPNGIDTTRFAPAAVAERQSLRDALGLDRNRRIVVFVGFFSADKQPDVLVDAWLLAQREMGLDATLVLVGSTRSTYFEIDAQMVDRLRAAAAAQGLENRLVCPGTTHVVEQYLRAADLFVLPSRREGLPVALLEAMACGLPCIASRLPGSTDTIIDDGRNGRLLPPGDVSLLASTMTRVLGDPSHAAALGAAARETVVQRFSSDHVAARWLEAYDLAAASRAPR